MEKKVDFLEEAPGVKSSTRKNSRDLLWFFFLLNVLVWVFIGYIAYTHPERGITDLTAPLLTLDSIILTGVFAPKYLHKKEEVSQFIQTFKVEKKHE